MAGCFVVYATTYTMPTLMPFMAVILDPRPKTRFTEAGHFTDSTEATAASKE